VIEVEKAKKILSFSHQAAIEIVDFADGLFFNEILTKD
jgi:hypothetical protein